MRAVGKVGEAVLIADSVSIATEESMGGLDQESVVFVFSIPAHNRTLGFGADCLGRVSAG